MQPAPVDTANISGYPYIVNRDIPIYRTVNDMRSVLIERNRCNCAVLRKASRRLSQLYDSILAPSGLRSTQYAILAEIDRRQEDLPTMRELADALVLDQSTVGQNLRPLEREGLILLTLDQADRRRRLVKLTKKGQSRLAAAFPLWEAAQRQFESSFGRQEAADLRALLLNVADEHVWDAANTHHRPNRAGVDSRGTENE